MDELRLIINNPEGGQFLREIVWNREDFESAVDEIVKDYVGVVYTDDQIQDAKKARAELNKAKKAISDRRIAVKKAVMEPYDKFEAEVKEITAKIDRAVEGIDDQIKAYESELRKKKYDYLEKYYKTQAADLVDYGVRFDQVSDPKMFNASYSVDAATKEIERNVVKVRSDLEVVKAEALEFRSDTITAKAVELFLHNLSLGEVITFVKQQREFQRIAEEERQRKEQELSKPAEQPVVQEQPKKVEMPVPAVAAKPVEPQKMYRASFQITGNGQQAKAVFDKLAELGIPSESVFQITLRGGKEELLAFKAFMTESGIQFGKGMANAG